MAERAARDPLERAVLRRRRQDRAVLHDEEIVGGALADETFRVQQDRLVRAGAMRIYRDDGTEWWRLLSRMDEFIERKALEKVTREI